MMDMRAARSPGVVLGLSEYHLRCLEKRLEECHQSLMRAVLAASEAKANRPHDNALHALKAALLTAQKLTYAAVEASARIHADYTEGYLLTPRVLEQMKGVVERISTTNGTSCLADAPAQIDRITESAQGAYRGL